jgi:hypothetical protein
MNILSLVSQNLDNFYQIQTKYYRNSDTVFFSPIHRTKRGLAQNDGVRGGGIGVCGRDAMGSCAVCATLGPKVLTRCLELFSLDKLKYH